MWTIATIAHADSGGSAVRVQENCVTSLRVGTLRLARGSVILAWIAGVLLPVYFAYQAACFNNWDLGIYTQALVKLGWGDWNPYLSVRDIRIFNDHFDPVLILFAWVGALPNPALGALGVELLFVLAAAGCLLYTWRSQPALGLAIAGLFLFSRATLNAVSFPVHPTTWAVFPLMGLALAVERDRFWMAFAWAAGLLLFKEEFVFVFVGLAGVCGVRRQYRYAAWSLVAAALAAGIVFWLRVLVVGETVNYAKAVLSLGVLQSPGFAKDVLKIFAPFFPFAWLMWRSKVRFGWAVPLVLAPSLAIRLLTGRAGFHYGTLIWVAALGVVLPLWFQARSARLAHPKAWVASYVLLAIAGLSYVSHFAVPIWRGEKHQCRADAGRMAEWAEVKQLLRDRSAQGGDIFAMGNLVPGLFEVWSGDIWHLGASANKPSPRLSKFWVLIEKQEGQWWPTSRDTAMGIVADSGATTLWEGRWFWLGGFNVSN